MPEDLLLTAFCYENDADMDALKNARFLEDSQDEQIEVRNHFLDHTILDKQNDQMTIMAFQHKRIPIWGVQFHPESVSTEHGAKMMYNFQVETWRWMTNKVIYSSIIMCVCFNFLYILESSSFNCSS